MQWSRLNTIKEKYKKLKNYTQFKMQSKNVILLEAFGARQQNLPALRS